MTNNSHRRSYLWTCPATAFALIAGALIVTSFQSLTAAEIITDPAATEVEYESSVFRPDPAYEDVGYDSEAQLEIYGGKSAFPTPRPLIELGREMYTVGSYEEAGTFLGALNPSYNQFLVYGDWRAAMAFNDNGLAEVGQVATRLNLEFDYRFTSTERIHWFIGPLDGQGEFTRCELFGDDAHFCEIKAQELTDLLGLDLLGDGGEIDNIGKKDSELLPLAFFVDIQGSAEDLLV